MAYEDAPAPTVARSGAAAAAGSEQGFVAVRKVAPLAVPRGVAFTFALSDDTFTHADAKVQVSLNAVTDAGEPLPDWLRFIPGERRFVGTAPAGVTQLRVRVVAQDERGEQASTVVTLNFGQ